MTQLDGVDLLTFYKNLLIDLGSKGSSARSRRNIAGRKGQARTFMGGDKPVRVEAACPAVKDKRGPALDDFVRAEPLPP